MTVLPKKLSLTYNNVDNSLLSKIDELRIHVNLEDPDIIILNEIKPKNGKMPDLRNLQLSEYCMFTNDTEIKDTRGTCIYIKNKYQSAEVPIGNHNFKDTNSVEIIGQNNIKILITVIYRSGSPEKAAANDEEMFRLLTCLPLLHL